MKNKEYINEILGPGDDVTFSIDEANGICTLDITFNGNVRNLDVEINRSTASERA